MKRSIIRDLIAWKDKKGRKPLIMRGARQVGKTFILKTFGKTFFPKYHYINFEENSALALIFKKDLKPQRIITEISFFLDTAINLKTDLLIFDEIQQCPEALTSLKYFCEEMSELALAVAGSLLGIHLNAGSFPVGKVDFLAMYPMSFVEFLQGIEDEKSVRFITNINIDSIIPDIIHNHLWEQLKLYFIVGGLPEVVDIFRQNKENLYLSLKLVREKQENLILAYLADMAKHSGNINAMHIDRVWRSIPTQLAKEQNGAVPKYIFKGIIPNINRFSKLIGVIDWLESAGLIIKINIVNKALLPFSAYCQENTFKLCVFDVGILGALSGLPVKTILDYDYGSYKGYFAENFIAQEFLCLNSRSLYSWREQSAEIEFLREINGQIIPIEVKSGWITKAKSLNVFNQKYKPMYRIIFSAKNLEINKNQQLYKYPIYLAGIV